MRFARAPTFVREAGRLESAAAQLAYAAPAGAAAAGSNGSFIAARSRVQEAEAAVRGALQVSIC